MYVLMVRYDIVFHLLLVIHDYFPCIMWIAMLNMTLNKKMSHLMGKPTICIGENKDADQLRRDREADQRLCFRLTDSTISLLLISKLSSI